MIYRQYSRNFPYACVDALQKTLSRSGYDVSVQEDENLLRARWAFSKLDRAIKKTLLEAGVAATTQIQNWEPKLDPLQPGKIALTLQDIRENDAYDNRDIVCRRSEAGDEIGFMIRWNTPTSRLSGFLLFSDCDFGNEWFGIPCSATFWESAIPRFRELGQLPQRFVDRQNRADSLSEILRSLTSVYAKEIVRIVASASNVVSVRLSERLVGRFDFYRVSAFPRFQRVDIEAFNFRGTLGKNRPRGSRVPKIPLPSTLRKAEVSPEANTRIVLYFEEPWQLSLHFIGAVLGPNPAIRFRVQSVGVPTSLPHFILPWD